MAKTEKVNLRLTPAQLAEFRQLVAAHDNAALLGALDTQPKRRVMGCFELVLRAVAANPALTLEALLVQFAELPARNVTNDYRRAMKVLAVLRETGRWNETVKAPEVKAPAEVGGKAKKAA